ncbi:hypothetical protein, partial [Brachyspira hampsonii]
MNNQDSEYWFLIGEIYDNIGNYQDAAI